MFELVQKSLAEVDDERTWVGEEILEPSLAVAIKWYPSHNSEVLRYVPETIFPQPWNWQDGVLTSCWVVPSRHLIPNILSKSRLNLELSFHERL